MPTTHGINVTENETALSTPIVADSGIPFVVGTAPIQSADNPAAVGVPALCNTWSEAKEKFGYSEDWEKYTICEAMFAQFQSYGMGPMIIVNLLDPSSMGGSSATETVTVQNHRASVSVDAILDTVSVVSDGSTLTAGTDYEAFYSNDSLVVELLSDGSAYSAAELDITYTPVDPTKVTTSDVAEAFDSVDQCLTTIGKVPDILLSPGYSQDKTVAAVMGAKASSINSLFKAVAVVDIDCSGAKTYDAAIQAKSDNGLTDDFQIVCWPMCKNGDRLFHLSSQIAGCMCKVDEGNDGVPYESPDNKSLAIDALCLDDGTELIAYTKEQADMLNEAGIMTAINFVNGWVCWGSYMACYPGTTDVKDYFIPVRRMFNYVGGTFVRTFWAKIGKPLIRRQIDSIVDTSDLWLNGLVASEYLLGARVVFSDDENPESALAQGKIKLHIYMTPPGPIQELDFVLEYDADYVSEALATS